MRKALLLGTCALLSLPTFAKPSQFLSAEQAAKLFSRGAEFSQLKISPKGDYISAITENDGKRVLVVLDTDSKKLINALNFPGNAQVGAYYWANDERIVLEKQYLKGWSDHPLYYGELFAINADGSKGEYIFGYNATGRTTGTNIKRGNTPIQASAYMIDPLPQDDRHVLIASYSWQGSNEWDAKRATLYKLDIYKGKRKKIGLSPTASAAFLTDHDGDIKVVTGLDKNYEPKLYIKTGDEWKTAKDLSVGLTEISPISFTDKPNEIYVSANSETNSGGIYSVDLNTGNSQLILANEKVQPHNFWINGQSKQLYAVEYEPGYPSYSFINAEDPRSQQLKGLIAALPGKQIRIISETLDGDKIIVVAFNDLNAGDYYLFETKTNKLGYLLSSHSWINPDDMSEMKPIEFTNRDGMTIHGYLTKPYGFADKNLPLVVMPHGGPHFVRDWWGYNPEVQMLASQGIAVLQVNFRGSAGYTEQFHQAGYLNWGTGMQHDIIDGVKHVINDGTVDKDRICIVGGSFGGFSAIQSPIIEPDLFKCAIGFAGVYDLEMMFEEGDVQESTRGVSYLKRTLGTDKALWDAQSPTKHVNKLKANLLLVHGGEDERAPIEQYNALTEALDKHNYPYESLVLSNEGHGFYKDEHRAKYYEKMLSFLKTNLKL